MLVLSRKHDEKLKIGENIVVTVVSIKKGVVQLGIEAPEDVNVCRAEIVRSIDLQKRRNLSDRQ